MSSYDLSLMTVVINNYSSKNDLKNALIELSNSDSDFNGENGLDCLIDEAEESGYESNQDYYLNEVFTDVKHISQRKAKDIIGDFIEYWMNTDSNYYVQYSYNIKVIEKTMVLSLSYMTYV